MEPIRCAWHIPRDQTLSPRLLPLLLFIHGSLCKCGLRQLTCKRIILGVSRTGEDGEPLRQEAHSKSSWYRLPKLRQAIIVGAAVAVILAASFIWNYGKPDADVNNFWTIVGTVLVLLLWGVYGVCALIFSWPKRVTPKVPGKRRSFREGMPVRYLA